MIGSRAAAAAVTACAVVSSVGRRRGVVEVDAQQRLGEVDPRRRHRRHVVGRIAIVDLEDGAPKTASVHRADHDLVVEQAEQSEVVDDVWRAEHAVHARAREGDGEPLEQTVPVGHRHRVGSHAESAARWMVGGDDEQAAVAA